MTVSLLRANPAAKMFMAMTVAMCPRTNMLLLRCIATVTILEQQYHL